MLSDYVENEAVRKELLSDNRYTQCFLMSIKTVFELSFRFAPDRLRIVVSKTEVNSEEGFFHAWAEFKSPEDDKWYAVDYTGNIIDESDEYIRLRRATIINVIPYESFDALYEYLEEWG
ncbi:MAG: hypothetical protein K2L98_01145, partial [Bacilli bacterium]|nr:hypothetical protein [Bacilli bacterium]